MLERIVGAGWGALDLSAPSIAFELGSLVEGTVAVHAKQQLGPGRLTVSIVCVRRDARSLPPVIGKRITRESTATEVWRSVLDIDTDVTLDAGDRVEYPFEIRLPERDDSDPQHGVPQWARGTIAVVNTITFARSSLHWQLRAKFHHPDGFDLRRNQSILVNP